MLLLRLDAMPWLPSVVVRTLDQRSDLIKQALPTDSPDTHVGFLPPIIFHSGYTLRRKVFIYYFVPIVRFVHPCSEPPLNDWSTDTYTA